MEVILFNYNLAKSEFHSHLSVSLGFVQSKYFGQLLQMRRSNSKFLKLANLYLSLTNVWLTDKYSKWTETDFSSVLLLFKYLMFLI